VESKLAFKLPADQFHAALGSGIARATETTCPILARAARSTSRGRCKKNSASSQPLQFLHQVISADLTMSKQHENENSKPFEEYNRIRIY